jgi:hypothetical protein
VSETALGAKARTGLMLYTAHLLAATSKETAGAAGALTSERVGDLSRSYAAPAAEASRLETTSYGQQYKQLINNEFRGGGEFVKPAY